MPYNPQKPASEIPDPNAYATPEQMADFVNKTLLAFADKGREFYDPNTADPDYPEYIMESIPYDADMTPNLPPFDSCSIKAFENGDTGLRSGVHYSFNTKVNSPDGERTLNRIVMITDDGTVSDAIYDSTPTVEKARQWQDLTEMTPEERREIFKGITAKMAVDATIAEFEGLPEAPEGITVGELEDLRKLLPLS